MAITLNRGSSGAVPFSITDSNNGLLGKRVTWSVGSASTGAAVLKKVGGLPGSSADITIATQTANAITGQINITAADYASLPASSYLTSLWIDDGALSQQCVTTNGHDTLTINAAVQRT
jgi:hypothetical protein